MTHVPTNVIILLAYNGVKHLQLKGKLMSFWDRYIKDNRIDLGNLQERANKLQEWFAILDGNEYSKFLRSDKHGNILKLLDESKKSVHIQFHLAF